MKRVLLLVVVLSVVFAGCFAPSGSAGIRWDDVRSAVSLPEDVITLIDAYNSRAGGEITAMGLQRAAGVAGTTCHIYLTFDGKAVDEKTVKSIASVWENVLGNAPSIEEDKAIISVSVSGGGISAGITVDKGSGGHSMVDVTYGCGQAPVVDFKKIPQLKDVGEYLDALNLPVSPDKVPFFNVGFVKVEDGYQVAMNVFAPGIVLTGIPDMVREVAGAYAPHLEASAEVNGSNLQISITAHR